MMSFEGSEQVSSPVIRSWSQVPRSAIDGQAQALGERTPAQRPGRTRRWVSTRARSSRR
jgi:hypothetical protein